MAQSTSSTNTRTASDYGRKTAEDLADKASDLAQRTGDQLERIAEQGQQATEQVQVVAENFKKAVDKSVKDQPLTTLAVAAGVGFIIGALWKS